MALPIHCLEFNTIVLNIYVTLYMKYTIKVHINGNNSCKKVPLRFCAGKFDLKTSFRITRNQYITVNIDNV